MQDAFDAAAIEMIDRDTKIKPTKKATNADNDAKSTKTAPAAKAVAAAPPSQQLVNPYARYGELEGGTSFFAGDYLRLDQKVGYVRGQNKTPVDTKQGYVISMMEAGHGFVKFARGGDGRPEHDVCLIREQPELSPCKACGRSAREHDEHPKQCDWRPTVYLPLRPFGDPSDVICFTGTGKGARIAVAELCKVYGRPGADRGGRDFVIMLETRSFPNSEGGTTVWPVFRQIGVEFFVPDTPAPPTALIAAPTTASAAKALAKRGDMDDEIPF